MTCEFAVGGICQVSTKLAGIPVPLAEGACKACLSRSDAKKSGNHVVIDRACWALIKAGQRDKAELLRLGETGRKLYRRELKERRRLANGITRIASFHILWKEFHAYGPEHAASWDAASARQWYAAWLDRVPRGGRCNCNSHWRQVTHRLPPDFSNAAAFHQWGIDAHNELNKLLGKPIWTPPPSPE